MPILEALTRLCHGEYGEAALDEIRALAPSWLAQMPGLAGPEEVARLSGKDLGAGRERMLREIVECLDGIAGIRPLVFVLEDLHWSDRSSLDVLSLVARRPDPAAGQGPSSSRSGERSPRKRRARGRRPCRPGSAPGWSASISTTTSASTGQKRTVSVPGSPHSVPGSTRIPSPAARGRGAMA